MGSWERLGRTLGLLVLVATLSACASSGPLLPEPRPGIAQRPGSGTSVASGRPAPEVAGGENETRVPISEPCEKAGADEPSSQAGETATTTGPSAQPPHVITHVVTAGETISGIAARYGLSPSTVAASAGLTNPNRIYPGQTLSFPSLDGVLYRVRAGDTLSGIAMAHGVKADTLAAANDLSDPNRLEVGRVLIVPGVPAGRATVSSSAATVATTASPAPAAMGRTLSWPVRGVISSFYGPRWGRMHRGIDIAASSGVNIRAAADGKVTYVGWYGQYGRCVIVDHGGGLTTLYAHASEILVGLGAQVKRGDPIARIGSTGNATGPHLHFEVRVKGAAQNPLLYLGD
ncbi:MAG: M23 family metallopeptidase [Bacillota bacterium]|nr:MAG: M23 family metallopeptidase [Bacillota bacterium]